MSQHNPDMEPDEELDPEIEAIVESIFESLPKSDVMMLNAQRVRDMKSAYDLIQTAVPVDSGVAVVCQQSEVANDMGYISIDGPSVEFLNSEAFAKIAGLASNTEVYPLAQNKVRVTFTFNGLMIPLE